MIRINLLPQAKRAVRTASAPSGGSTLWAGIYFVGAILWAVILTVIYFSYDATLQEQVRANNALNGQIQALRTKSARLEEVQSQLEGSRALEQVVDDLNRARTGPVRAMMELSKLLSTCPPDQAGCNDVGPTIDAEALEAMRDDNPYATYNRSWDVRRLWLASFEEDGRGCRIKGSGRTNEDVAEFLRRLALSELFDDVMLQRTEAKTDTDTGLELIEFELTCRVTY